MTDLRAGEVVGERYCLESKVGEGGMASVWRARDQTLDRPVAVKFLFAGDLRKQDEMGRAFLREARIAAAVRHRNVVNVLDFGTHRSGVPFMVMELLEGETVEDRLVRGERFALSEALGIAVRVLRGLGAVHDAGIVHRDLKPANIFLVQERGEMFPKLLDFGISRGVNPESGPRSALTTKDGLVIGTPEYMSTEQARGMSDVDRRTDIYSLGVILYELITGKLPFDSTNQGDLIVQIMTATPKPLKEVVPEAGEALSDAVMRALSREREERFESTEKMEQVLLAAAEELMSAGAVRSLSLKPPAPRLADVGRAGTVSVWNQPPRRSTPTAFEATGSGSGPSTVVPLVVRRSGEEEAVAEDFGVADTVPPEGAGAGESRAARRWVWFAVVGAVAVVGIGVGVALSLSEKRESEAAPRFIVVKGTSEEKSSAGSGTAAGAADKMSGVKGAGEESAGGKAAEGGAKKRGAGGEPARKPKRRKKARKPESREAMLARKFAEQKAGVEKCFVQHADKLEGAAQLSVRLSLSAAGAVKSAQVSPAAVAGGELGRCIATEAGKMKFGRQQGEISLEFP